MSLAHPTRPQLRQRLRERWRLVHLWLGWGLGALFALFGLSGSLLVVYPELDALMNPALIWRPEQGCIRQWEPVLQALQRAEPWRERGWRIELPEGGCGTVTARYLRPPERAGAFFAPRLVSLRADTLEPVAQRYWGETAMTWLFDLHYTGLAGTTGRSVVGVLGLLLLASLVSGLLLWWPRSAAQWRSAWWPKPDAGSARRTWDRHRLVGLYGAPLLLLLALTGALLALPQWVDPLVASLSAPLPLPTARSTPPAATATTPAAVPAASAARIPLDQALAAAQARFPLAQARWVDTPDGPEGVYRVRLQQPGEPSRRFPKTWVLVDAYSAAVLGVRDAQQQGHGDAGLAWLHPLHNGEVAGWTGRALVALAGLALPYLWITGLRRWLDRRRGRHAARAPSRPPSSAGAACATTGTG
ncbi:MAG TPA: PepSY domain-containing protein [Burkholderiaceae bacterium]|nr:PepSY domain-containing protein [Burkholderiaceae bacterium]HMX11672.1 PepSY domain-containing protein [Burkholderiaceae bacterium]HMZ00817.1 PepSY domain-containing protein [Burkholderiaceae bacterium]HNB45746.1 PepSY domain-containing protein [Burkholderiaceae bacterium]HNG78155.1 PepSY domain-containing protein [Burkholderiaceae bacterium]